MASAISVRGLKKSYGEKIALAGIDLDVAQGEIFALLGPNGAGKTTTVEILEGYRRADKGEVRVLGEDPAHPASGESAWRDRIGIVLQSTSDVADLTVRETIHHFSHYYSKHKEPDQVMALVGLGEKADAKIGTLSGGQRRRVDVALGIIGSPELLFLDEPTTGFDPEARRAFWDLILTLKAEGTTILLTTHYLDEAEFLADRVGVINDGALLEVSTPAQLGGRADALATVTWLENGTRKSQRSNNPSALVLDLVARLGDVQELEIKRPSLEDIYLSMIGQS